MNWNHVAHIIRDVFKNTSFTLCYQEDMDLLDTLHTAEHGIGAMRLWSALEPPLENSENSYYWPAGINGMFFGDDCVDLFISINYDPEIFNNNYDQVAQEIKRVLKSGGFILAVNPGNWASSLESEFTADSQIVKEIKRYSLFNNKDVRIYENV
jgi:SAM-dependent methyltransferase